MTIQKTVILGVAGLMMATVSTANAQCSRGGRYRVPVIHSYRPIVHVTPRVSYRPQVHVALRPQTGLLQPLPPVSFGACSHVDDLASRLELLMNELCLDLYYNYSHNPGFPETYAEAYSLYQTAQSIHAAQHNFDRATVQNQLAGADALFHHIQDDVFGWSRNPHRQIGALGLQERIDITEDTLHHLMEDVGVAIGPVREEPPVPGTFAPQPQPLSNVPQLPQLPQLPPLQ